MYIPGEQFEAGCLLARNYINLVHDFTAAKNRIKVVL
jgi:hypothetical protein